MYLHVDYGTRADGRRMGKWLRHSSREYGYYRTSSSEDLDLYMYLVHVRVSRSREEAVQNIGSIYDLNYFILFC